MSSTDADRRYVVVSTDSHVGPSLARQLRGYCPAAYLDEFDDFVAGRDERPRASSFAGCDNPSPEMAEALARTRSCVGLQDPQARLRDMDAEGIDFPDESFDCVTVPYVLSVTPEPDRLVQEVRRVCRRDGHILLVNHFSGSPVWWTLERAVKPLAARVGFRSEFRFERHVSSHDWTIESVRTVNVLGLSKLVVLRNA